MHSRIFQMSPDPINKGEYISESDYYEHWFTNEIADYVNDDCNRDEDIKWLGDYPRGYVVDKDSNGYYIIVNSKEEYFANAFNRFKEALEKLGTPTIGAFVSTHGVDLWPLKDSYEDEFGFYVDYSAYDCGRELMTFDRFIRRCDIGQKYYIGGTVDYHF